MQAAGPSLREDMEMMCSASPGLSLLILAEMPDFLLCVC